MHSPEFCDDCGTAMEYEPAEYESLSGRSTVEQYSPGYICPNCGNEKPLLDNVYVVD